jgi:O-antigen/teichoic acid export membrane protein
MGFHSLGILNRGISLLNAFNQALLPPVIRVALPALAARHREGQGLSAQYARSVSIMSVVAFPFFGFVGLLAFPLIRVLFGAQWDESVPILRIAAVGFGIGSMCAFAPTVLTSLGQVRTKFLIQVIALLVYIPVLAVLALVSLKAVAIGMVIAGLVPFFLYSLAMRGAIGFGWRDLARALGKSAMVSGAVLFGPAILITSWNEGSPIVALLAAGSWATSVWAVTVWATRHPIMEELDGVRKHIRGAWQSRSRYRHVR